MTVWIGYLQWTRQHGTGTWGDPILRPMDTFECKDAILDLSDPEHPREPDWPRVDFIVGNPPFLGTSSYGGSWAHGCPRANTLVLRFISSPTYFRLPSARVQRWG